MTAIVVIMQLLVIGLCLWGEFSQRIKSTVVRSISLGTIAIATLLSIADDPGTASVAAIIYWLLAIGCVVWLLRKWARITRTGRAPQ